MKSLYALLKVHPAASGEEIEAAYKKRIAEFPSDGALLSEDDHIQLIALKEAYTALSNPTSRQVYDQKLKSLIENRTQPPSKSSVAPAAHDTEQLPLPLAKILLSGAIALGGLLIYTHHSKEQERIRIEKEREIALRVIKIEEDKQRRAEIEQQERLERQQRLEEMRIEEQNKREHKQALRETEIRSRQIENAEERRNRQEAIEKRRKEAEEETRRIREQQETERRLASYRRELTRPPAYR